MTSLLRFVAAAATLYALLTPPLCAQSGAVGLCEVSTVNAGEACAGQSAIASDASTVYFNPAGMTRLLGRQIVFGAQALHMSMTFRAGFPGERARDAGSTNLVPGAYFAQRLNDRVSAGFSLNQPFGAALAYGPDWAGRYAVEDIKLIVMDLRPTMAVRINRNLSVGGGPSILRASLSKTLAVPNLFDAGFAGDGSAHAGLHDWAYGWNAGGLYEFGAKTRVGVTYRSKAEFALRGPTELKNVGPAMTGYLARSLSGATPFHLPQGANVSLVRVLNPRLTVLADGGWTNWRHFREQTVSLPDGSSVVTDANWRDTWRIGVGMRCRSSASWQIQAGAAYDSSPVTSWNRTPDVPVDRQVRLAMGVLRHVSQTVTMGLSYSYVDLGRGRIDDLLNPFSGPAGGRYSPSRLQMLAVSFSKGPRREE